MAIAGPISSFLVGFAFYLIRAGRRGRWPMQTVGVLACLSWILREASRMSYEQIAFRVPLEGEPLRRFMNATPVTVPADIFHTTTCG
jgi:hypothetical protein